MPSSLENAIARNQALTDSGQKVYSAELPPAEAPLPPPLPTISGLPIRGVLPSSMTESTDFANTTKQGGVPMRSGIFPPQAQPPTTTKTTVVVGAASSSAPAATLALSTNNMTNPVQNKINFIGQGGTTITSDASGNEIISSSVGSDIIGPGFALWQQTNDGIFATSQQLPGANGIGGNLFFLPTQITTVQITFHVAGTDPVNSFDIGIYGPFTGVETTIPLLANTGPAVYASAISFTVPWRQASVTLQPGYYFLEITTSSGSPSLTLTAQQAQMWLYASYIATPSTGSTLPSAIAVPTAAPTVTTGVSGTNEPSTIAFILN